LVFAICHLKPSKASLSLPKTCKQIRLKNAPPFEAVIAAKPLVAMWMGLPILVAARRG